MKYVYLIKSLSSSEYKIGVSKDPHMRIKNIQTGNSEELVVIDRYYTEYPNKIETSIHNLLSGNKKKGEWFDLSISEEVKFVELCKNIEKTINFLKESGNPFI